MIAIVVAGTVLAGCGRSLPTEDAGSRWSSHSLGAAERARLAAEQAEREEAAERATAIALLRTLAGRYRESRRPNAIEKLEYAAAERRSATAKSMLDTSPVSRSQTQGAAVPKVLDNDALRERFAGSADFDILVNRCLDLVADTTSRALDSGEKLFGWLCRAAILPEAAVSAGAGIPAEEPDLEELSTGVGRLIRMSEKCEQAPSAACEDVDRTIDQIITQQPIVPVPAFRDKVAVDRTAIPPPKRIVSAAN